MTTARHIRANDVLGAIERHGPVRLSRMTWDLLQAIETDREDEWEDRDDIAKGFFALRRGRFIWIARLDGDVELWGTTAKGRALIASRRAKGR